MSASPFTVETITAELAHHLEIAYNTIDPIARTQSILRVEELQKCDIVRMEAAQLAGAALALMQKPDVSLSTRAYGAVMLKYLMQKFGLSADDSHYMDIVQWIIAADDSDDCYGGRMTSSSSSSSQNYSPVAASSIHRVVVSSCSLLAATAAVMTWPEHGSNLIDLLVGKNGNSFALAKRRNTQKILLEVCRACCEPVFNSLPRHRIAPLRKATRDASPLIMAAAVSTLETQYVYLKTTLTNSVAANNPAALAAEGGAIQFVCEDMGNCVEILSLAARTCEPMLARLWEANVDHALGTLVTLDCATVSMYFSSQANGNGDFSAIISAINKIPLIALEACVTIIGNVSKDAIFPKELPHWNEAQQAQHRANIERLAAFCTNVVSTMGTFVGLKEYDAVNKLVEITSKSASLKNIQQFADTYGFGPALSVALLNASVTALKVPNVSLATDICESISDRLQCVIEECNAKNSEPAASPSLANFQHDTCFLMLSYFAVRDHYNAWTPFIPRHNPQETEYQAEGRKLSEMQCDSSDAFMSIYSQLRSAMTPLCAALAAIYPVPTRAFIAHLLDKLNGPLPQDPKSPHGNITQRSSTYATWDAVEYLIGCLLAPAAFSKSAGGNSSDNVYGIIAPTVNKMQAIATQVFASPTSDATLAPVFLNLYQHVWAVCLPSAEFMFSGIPKRVQTFVVYQQLVSDNAMLQQIGTSAVNTLYAFMRKVPSQPGTNITADPDLVSARKRSMTLLIRFCSTFAPGVAAVNANVGKAIVTLIKSEAERSLVADKVMPSERSLLNEAMAGLTNVMSSEDAEASTKALLGPSVETLQQMGGELNVNTLAFILCDSSRQSASKRDTLRDCVSTLTAVLRRSAVSPFTSQVAQTIIPFLGNITLTVHSLNASHLPPDFVGILDPTDDEQKLAMIHGSGVRRPPDLTNKIGNTRRYFAGLRMALYQGIALLPRFLPVQHFEAGIVQILEGSEHFTVPTMRDLCEQCLFPVTAECPSLITVTLGALQRFLYQQSLLVGNSTEKQQIVDAKQQSYFTKDICAYIRATLIEGKKYQDIQKGPPIEGPSFQSNAMALTGSSSATYPFLSSRESLQLFVASLCALFAFGSEMRSVSYLSIIALNEMLRRETSGMNANDPSASSAYLEACLTLFACNTISTITNRSMDRQNTRDYLLAMLSDLYINHFPTFAASLTIPAEQNQYVAFCLGGLSPILSPPSEVEQLHSHLMAVKGPRQKRQCFTDFIIKRLPIDRVLKT